MVAAKLTDAVTRRKYWTHETLRDPSQLTTEVLKAMFHGELSGIRIPEFISEEARIAAVSGIAAETETETRYREIESDLGTKTGIPSHWEFHYTGRDWCEYYPLVEVANEKRKQLFGEWGDPVELVTEMLQSVWHSKVGIAMHPSSGKSLYAGLIRNGVPKLHVDWVHWDMPGFDAVMQAGWSIYLNNPGPGGDLAVYRVLGMEPGLTAENARHSSGVIGNYGLPRDLIRKAEVDVIPCQPGDWVITPNRFLHEVTPCPVPNERMSIAAHVAWMGDGTLAQFS